MSTGSKGEERYLQQFDGWGGKKTAMQGEDSTVLNP